MYAAGLCSNGFMYSAEADGRGRMRTIFLGVFFNGVYYYIINNNVNIIHYKQINLKISETKSRNTGEADLFSCGGGGGGVIFYGGGGGGELRIKDHWVKDSVGNLISFNLLFCYLVSGNQL